MPIGVGYDLVINAKTELATAEYSLVEAAFQQTMRRFYAVLQKRAHESSVDNISLGEMGREGQQ